MALLLALLSGCAEMSTATSLAQDGFVTAQVNTTISGHTAVVQFQSQGHRALPDAEAGPRAAGMLWRTLPHRIDRMDVYVGTWGGSYSRDLLTRTFGPRDPALDEDDGGSGLLVVFGSVALVVLLVVGGIITTIVILVRRRRRRPTVPGLVPGPHR